MTVSDGRASRSAGQAPPETGAIPVLLYHSVSDTPAGKFGAFTVSRAQLAAHLDLMLEQGYQPITVRQLLDGLATGQLPPRPVVLTFDDGFADFAANAWPLLTDRGLAATLYVTAGDLGGRSEWLASAGVRLPMLTPREIADLAADGCEIGAHSMTHPHLDCLPHAVAYEEIRTSKDVLEQVLGQAVDTFAYPHGYHSRATKELVMAAGYRSATAVRNALSHADDDRYAIARVTVTSDFGPADIARVLTGTGVRTAGPREHWQTAVWRQARRLARPLGSWSAMMQVITPAPREEWRAALAGDSQALPEHAPEWIDALCADGRYTDASRYYVLDDGRTFVLPLVARRGPLGLGGWLQCFPPSWGIGGLVGADADADVLRAVLADLRGTRSQRIGLRPDPTRWAQWSEAVDRLHPDHPAPRPRHRPHRRRRAGLQPVLQVGPPGHPGGREVRGPGGDRSLRRPAGGVLPALSAVDRPLGRAAARAAGPGPVPGQPARSAEQAAGHVGAPGQGVRGGPGLRRRPPGLRVDHPARSDRARHQGRDGPGPGRQDLRR